MALYGFNILDAEYYELDKAIDKSPKFNTASPEGLKRLLAHSIGTVHAIASKLHYIQNRNQLVLYYGRTQDTAESLRGRWRSRNHDHATILGRLPSSQVCEAEGNAIRLFKTLEAASGLCIKSIENLSSGSNGPLGSSRSSLLYLTWRFERAGATGKLSPIEVSELADQMYEDMTVDLAKQSLKTILNLTRTYSHLVPIQWYPGHE